ncbi:hypothetical protein [Asticcacaulis sp.]|uniref:hypothetical protein n=1 Tax=Asticcacaulis sp. TaxID=1872648 RepID=UPI002BC250BC|nr:hypothetical protein [Asticcacaulis sp.]HTM81910.1 hypothetical protein [Asticcacaulis sp.]
MDAQTNGHLSSLREALLTLSPTGPDGFEGFLAVVLTSLCGQPFRLATSGSQRGRDGDFAFDDGATYFEGKRYEDAIPIKEVAVKLMDLRGDNQGQVDTWVLGSTVETPALHADDFTVNAAADG